MPVTPAPVSSAAALDALWSAAGLPPATLAAAQLPGAGPVMPSSFAVATAAQASLAAAALAAVQIGRQRGAPVQTVSVERANALLECSGHFTIDGRVPPIWDKLSGLYPAGADTDRPGWVRIHANFAHHRDAALRVLGLPEGDLTGREQVTDALRRWAPIAFEDAVAAVGGVAAAARSFAEWDAHPQATAVAKHPPVELLRLDDAPPLPRPVLPDGARPLHGLRVLDLTRILAGPAGARLLAGYGADVLMVNGPHLPNIDHIADLSRGKRSCRIDLREPAGHAALLGLVDEAQVLLQGYRPGALAARGFGPAELALRRPGLVVATLSAYGDADRDGGPWAARRGFDSLVQTATGFNLAEAEAFGSAQPKAMPVQILDFCAGHLLAFGIEAALWRQADEGGSWQVRVSLAGVGHWLRTLGREPAGTTVQAPSVEPLLHDVDSGFGRLRVLRHAAAFSATPAAWPQPAMPPGSHPPAWW